MAFVERVRCSLAARPYVDSRGNEVPIYLSFGVATFPQHGPGVNELVANADAALYTAKQFGSSAIAAGQDPHQVGRREGFDILEGLVIAVDNKDHYTRKHSDDVTKHALLLADALALSDEERETLFAAGRLHDVGKIGVPDEILRKPGSLDPEEYEIIKQHAHLGELIVKAVPHLDQVHAAIASHHERFDGSGYPHMLKGENIPLLGRILAVSDAWSAMTTDRPYRAALSPADARSELRRVAGSQLDPALVEIFLAVLESEPEASSAASGWMFGPASRPEFAPGSLAKSLD
jgi:HD-GYP domain-containing protein (c-di-GMP phosphodiesterase class II)